MIYWLVEKASLSECHKPYLKLTEELVEPGRKTAKAYYNAKGWLAHTCTNPWGFTSPCEDASWGSTAGAPAWQCHHLWEHYLYTLDKEYLACHCDETDDNPPLLDLEHCRYPFQIDGNQGNASVILLMILDDRLVFEEDGTVTVHIYPLPALSPELMTGKVTGLKAKGNVTVDMEWENGRIIKLDYQAPEGNSGYCSYIRCFFISI